MSELTPKRWCTSGAVPGRLYGPGPDPLDPPVIKQLKAWRSGVTGFSDGQYCDTRFPDGQAGEVTDVSLDAAGNVLALVYVPGCVASCVRSRGLRTRVAGHSDLWDTFGHCPRPRSTSSANSSVKEVEVPPVKGDAFQRRATALIESWREGDVLFADGKLGTVTEISINNDTGAALALVRVKHCLAPRDAN